MNLKETWNLVWVYWTLKTWFGNYWVMEIAKWEFVKKDYVPFKQMAWRWFPITKFQWNDWTKLLEIEIFKVSKEWIEWPLDRLEWYPHMYNRLEVQTESWETVTVYEYQRDFDDNSESFIEKEEWDKTYYSWTR